MKVVIIYGSTGGNTATVASQLKDAFASLGEVELHDISANGLSPAADADLLVLGASTWGIGDIQDDWMGHENLDEVDVSGKFVAVFGTGDQMGFGDSFVDAIGILAESAEKAGAKLVGRWSADGYDFSSSVAERDGEFLGLPIDEDNQPSMTAERISGWVARISQEVG